MAEYEGANKKALKFKGDLELGTKKKKKKKEKQKLLEQVSKVAQVTEKEEHNKEKPSSEIHKTKAELAFVQMQQAMQNKRILEKASKTHKQRVEDFNRHLDALTEHFDIPKVSWTK